MVSQICNHLLENLFGEQHDEINNPLRFGVFEFL